MVYNNGCPEKVYIYMIQFIFVWQEVNLVYSNIALEKLFHPKV